MFGTNAPLTSPSVTVISIGTSTIGAAAATEQQTGFPETALSVFELASKLKRLSGLDDGSHSRCQVANSNEVSSSTQHCFETPSLRQFQGSLA
jgi:hypothetical protein